MCAVRLLTVNIPFYIFILVLFDKYN
jgi:hypothetical protein